MVCRKRLDALLEEHIRIKHPQRFSYYEANRELIGTVTDRTPKTTENRKVLAPLHESSNLTPLSMSPTVAKQCEEILKGVDLFEEQEGYNPMNLDGTFPELDKVHHPTPVLAVNTATQASEERTSICTRAPLSPVKESRRIFISKPKEIPLERRTGYHLSDPRDPRDGRAQGPV